MRVLCLCLLTFPLPLLAEDIVLSSDVTDVTVYPQGATVLRETTFDMPAGQHRLILNDLPRSTPLERIRVEVIGATMGNVTTRRDAVPPRDAPERPDIAAARAEVERLEEQLRIAGTAISAIGLEAEAAQARVRFLDRLGANEGMAQLDVAALRALSGMIGEETLAALQQAQEANLRAEAATRDLSDLKDALARAKEALAALQTETQSRASLTVDVSAETAGDGQIRVRYVTDAASWTPVYDLRLSRGDGALDLERGAFVAQATGEDWRDVAMTLSTVRPGGQVTPSELDPRGLRIFDEDKLPRPLTIQRGAKMAVADAPMMEARVIEAVPQFDGINVSYAYPAAVTVATGADRARLSLGTLSLRADLHAQAVPLYDDTAFLMASITNDAQELILPTAEASLYLDDRYIGQRALDLIPAGGTADLSFGPIDGLRLSRAVEGREEGDRGVISKSNEIDEVVRMEVQNLTGEAWPLRVLDRVPFSEQEDLEITWQADPRPTNERVDDKRGVIAWEFDLAAGDSQTIRLSHKVTWPDGMMLR